MKYKLMSFLNDYWYRYGRPVIAVLMYVLAVVLWLLNARGKARNFCCASIRYGISSSSAGLLQKILLSVPFTKDDTTEDVSLTEAAGRTIVIKWPEFQDYSCVGKGIIIITFTRTFSFYLRNINLEELEKYFHIVLEPSWSGYADPDILAFMGRVKKVIVQSSEVQDRALLNCFPETFIAASFGASDWVDTTRFSPIVTDKKYDSIYIANTNPIKRVKRYLNAIKNLVDSGARDYKGCLVCASWGGAEKLIAEMVKSFNLNDNIVLRFDLSTTQVIEALSQSKVNILLSYKEGSNRSLFESMFCGTPVICIYENVGVNKAYINEYTGLLILDGLLERSLIWMGEHYTKFDPRSWAFENISPVKTTEKLKKIIASSCLDGGVLSNRKDALVKVNNPEVSYFNFPHLKANMFSTPLLEVFMQRDLDFPHCIESLSHGFFAEISQ